MVNSYLLAKIMQYNNISVKELAGVLRKDVKEVKDNLNHGVWQSNELEIMLNIFEFPINPMEVFFTTYDPSEHEY